MAVRISGLSYTGTADKTYVFELDHPSGSTAQTEKVNVEQLNDLIYSVNDSWTSLTLVNGWTGSVKMRVDKDGYLEIFYELSKVSATSDTVVTSIPSALVPDHTFRKSHYATNSSGDQVNVSIVFTSSAFAVSNRLLQDNTNSFVGYFREPLLAP